MTFTQFTAFAAVAKHLNVTKAANMLHVSQPSLSKHLKALEENFKLRLFHAAREGHQAHGRRLRVFQRHRADPGTAR